MKNVKLVTIGGGSGQFVLLQALRDLQPLHHFGLPLEIAAVVSMSDSGGSSGVLRDQYGILPPGDVLKCLLALSPFGGAREIFHHRFNGQNSLNGHNAGNLLMTILSQHLGRDFLGAVQAFAEILRVQGEVLPVTIDQTTLVAQFADGKRVFGETNIDRARGGNGKIKEVYLVPHSGELKVYPRVLEVIDAADFVLISPGDLYTSILPVLLVPGVAEHLQRCGGNIVQIMSIMTKRGETDNYTAADFLREITERLGRKIDCVVINTGTVSDERLANYRNEGAQPVLNNVPADVKQIAMDLVGEEGGVVRHDVSKLRAALLHMFLHS